MNCIAIRIIKGQLFIILSKQVFYQITKQNIKL